MPQIIDYETVLGQMRLGQFKCHYYNSGAFGFPDSAPTRTLAWLVAPDDTLRAAARPLARTVAPPPGLSPAAALALLATRLWQEHLPGPAWVMPMSHWAYEISHGNADWLPALVESLELDARLLESRNNAAAIEFAATEAAPFERLIGRMMERLQGSDFMLAFPGRPALCMMHHHKQLWWTSPLEELMAAVEASAAPRY